MSPSSAQSVPSIHIHNTDNYSSFYDGGFYSDLSNPYTQTEDNSNYNCDQGLLDSSYTGMNAPPSFDLEDIGTELSHLTTTMNHPPYLTGSEFSLPYSDPAFTPESYSPVDGRLTPSGLFSPMPSPSSSINGSFSPGSYCSDVVSLSDLESPNSPSPATPEDFLFPPSSGLVRRRVSASSAARPSFHQSRSSDSAIPPAFLDVQVGHHHRSRSLSSLSPSPRQVASQAMLEANTRRRRHPAQHKCETCGQTFTAAFSLKRHTQSHTGERPYVCAIPGCGQQFFNSSDCKRHEKSTKRHKDLVQ
jgi:hypothetical protein